MARTTRDTQFRTVFNMFTKNMEGIEEIREIALSMTEEQKAITSNFCRTIERMQKKMYFVDYQNLVLNLKKFAKELKKIKS